MGDENEFMKLPTDEKCVHKLWKARVAGYEEAIKLFNQIDDEKSPEWSKYFGLIKKFVTDSNAVAQEKGLEAALVFVENCGHAGKTTGEVMSGIVSKCIAAPRTKTKDLALQVILMYVEIEKPDIVQEELMKGMEHKNPRIVAACISATTTALRQFGNKVFSIKPLVKKIPITLADRDKDVRAEGKALVVEMHRWVGPAIEPNIASLQAVVQQELRDAFSAAGSAQPTRWLKSQQARQAELATQVDDECDGGAEEDDSVVGAGDSPDMDPYDLMEPVDILSKLPKDFYDKLEAKKWQERKEALDSLENVLKNAIRLETGDYADLVRALKKVISKDSNVMLVALSGRLLGSVASGLRNKFQPYAVSCVSAILEKFKERKVNVVTSLREAIDAIYPCTNLEAILEEVLEALNNKNPSVKAETSLFLARAFCRTQPAAFNKKMLKAYVGGLLKLIESAEPIVRDASAEALGTAMKLVTEKNIAPHIGKLDNLKEQKIKEFCDKAVITVKVAGPKKEARPKSAPAAKEGALKAGSAQPKAVKRPTTGVKKVAPGKKAAAGASKQGAASKASAPALLREQELSQEEVDERADELFSTEVMAGLADTNWKTRLSSIQTFTSTVQGLSPSDGSAQVLLRALNKKPGLKDTNFQVLKCRLEVVKLIAQSFTISATSVDFIIQDVVEKLGDAKCSSVAADALTALAEATKLEHVGLGALEYAMDKQKNPKVQAEVYNWLANAIREFGFSISIKSVIAHSKKGVGAINPAVRTSCIAFLGVVSLYVGPSIIQHFDGEKPALKQQIMQEFDKYANDKAPSPIRGLSKSASKASMGEDLDEESANDYGDDEPAPAVVQDTTTRTDISLLITDSLISEINDKNWKVRNEGLDKLRAIIATSSPIKSTLGELPPALASRLLDSNSKIAQMALQIAESLATAMGPKCKTHVRAFFPGFFLSLGDSKQWIRSAALQCLGTWCVQAGGAQVALDGEMVHDTLKAGSPALKAELLQWLAESLPDVPNKSFPKEELSVCLPVLYAAVEDRNADVRKNAGEAVLGFMLHLGYEAMHKQLEKLKPASKPVVLAALDKARPNLPVQPLPTAKAKPDGKAVKSGGAQKKEAEKKGAGGNVQKVKGIVKPSSATGKSKKEEEEALMPLMPNNNAKNQRIIDDQKLKVLKWNFTQPREEFFDLLKDQMTSAGLNKQLIANMFHADFRYHLKALESLLEDLSENGSALMANLDLVLKWLTLRFFDTNPSVILKGLEYLSAVFNYLISEEYTMAEYEANCFIPYLVLKVGDPKDSVRNGVKALFKQICIVYSVTKLFGYLMEGLKSKNARQRSECMECICHLMECYGSSVCAPSAAVALRELARHIGDRDNAVRSAALNCVTQAYFLEGEKIYKMIGQISDKDQSLLEERIKRAAKTRSAENRKSTLLPLTSTGKQLLRQHSDPCLEESELRVPENQISVDAVPGVYEDRSPEPEPAIPVVVRPQPAALLNGPFGLDPELIAKLDAMKPSYAKHETPEIDIQFLDETVTVATVRPSIAVAGMKNNMLPMSPPSIISSAGRPPASFLGPPSLQPEDNLLTHFIHSIASPNLNVATTAMSHIKEVAMSGRGAALRPHEEQLLRAAATQVRQLRLTPPSPDVHAAFKYIMAMLTALYESKEACGGSGEAGSAVLAQLVSELLRVLAARTLETATDAPRLVRALNYVCVRVLDGSDHTNLLCALMTLLHESIGGDMRYQELLMKCLWKVLKMIPNWEPGSMDYDALMYRIHLFYMAYPNSYWKKNTEMNDTPCRTVKTLVHSLVKIKGSAIMNHLSQIPDATETELYAYLLKLFKQLKLEERKENVEVNGGGSKMSRAVHDELGHILKRISEKGTSRDALVQLYELRERHPAIDIWTYMRGSSLHFRSYIERGLRDVAEERRGGAPLHHVAAGVYSSLAMSAANVAAHAEVKDDPNEPEGGEKNYTYFLERLRALQTQAGLRNDAAPGSQPRTPVIDNKAMVDSFSGDPVRTHNIDPQFDLHPSQPLSQRNEAGVDALRQKLQQIKSSSKR